MRVLPVGKHVVQRPLALGMGGEIALARTCRRSTCTHSVRCVSMRRSTHLTTRTTCEVTGKHLLRNAHPLGRTIHRIVRVVGQLQQNCPCDTFGANNGPCPLSSCPRPPVPQVWVAALTRFPPPSESSSAPTQPWAPTCTKRPNDHCRSLCAKAQLRPQCAAAPNPSISQQQHPGTHTRARCAAPHQPSHALLQGTTTVPSRRARHAHIASTPMTHTWRGAGARAVVGARRAGAGAQTGVGARRAGAHAGVGARKAGAGAGTRACNIRRTGGGDTGPNHLKLRSGHVSGPATWSPSPSARSSLAVARVFWFPLLNTGHTHAETQVPLCPCLSEQEVGSGGGGLPQRLNGTSGCTHVFAF